MCTRNTKNTRKMKKIIFSILLLILFSVSTFAQIDTVKNIKSQSNALSIADVSLGIGAGLDYGGLGVNFLIYPQKNVGVFGGAGYAFAGLGWNAGIKVRLSPEKPITPFAIVMYGYNAFVSVKNAEYYNKLFYGVSIGLGIDIRLSKSGNSQLQLALLIPIRSVEVQNYIDFLQTHGVQLNGFLPFTFSIGFKI